MRNARITALNSCSRGKFEGKLIRCPDHIFLIHCALYWSFLAHCARPLFTNNAVLCAPFFSSEHNEGFVIQSPYIEHLTLFSLTNKCFKVRVKRGGVLQARVWLQDEAADFTCDMVVGKEVSNSIRASERFTLTIVNN